MNTEVTNPKRQSGAVRRFDAILISFGRRHINDTSSTQNVIDKFTKQTLNKFTLP